MTTLTQQLAYALQRAANFIENVPTDEQLDVKSMEGDSGRAAWSNASAALAAHKAVRDAAIKLERSPAQVAANPIESLNNLIELSELFGSQQSKDRYIADRDAVAELLWAADEYMATPGLYGPQRLRAALDRLPPRPMEEAPHPEDAPDYIEFPNGEFPPQGNVGPLR